MVARSERRFAFRLSIWGVLAVASPLVGSISVLIPVGAILIGAGLAFIHLAFEAQTRGKGMLPLLLGLEGCVTGTCLLIWPGLTIVPLTALLTTHFLLSSVFTLAFAWELQSVPGWGLMVFSGVVSLFLAGAMWYQFPLSGEWAVGLLVGVNLLTIGSSVAALEGFLVSG